MWARPPVIFFILLAGAPSFLPACGPSPALPDAQTEDVVAHADAFVAADAFAADAFAADAFVVGDARVPRDGALLQEIPRAGGDTTHDRLDASAFLQPASNLSLRRRGGFEAGLQFFRLAWEVTPGQAETDGLGPTYNARSCIACHDRNGRAGNPLESPVGLLLRLGSSTGVLDERYGGQLQDVAVAGVPAEGRVRVSAGTPVAPRGLTLTPLVFAITELAFGALSADTHISPRISPQLVGMGLLEAIDEGDILRLEDVDDADGDGVSGRAARGDHGILRFGWKASQPTVHAQCAAAFAGDLGVTSDIHPAENCPPVQSECAAAPRRSPDIDAARLDATADYVSLLGVPAHRHADVESYRHGAALFAEVGCASCHTPSHVTGDATEPELSGQTIWPYTDLLLHDMGPALADGVHEGDARPEEWRTPPLWGLGLVEEVNGGLALMHDGRARSIEEAIHWHGGEAAASVERFVHLNSESQQRLLRFVSDL